MIPIHDSQRSFSKPYVTILLIGLNVLAFLFELSLDPYTRNDFIAVFGLVPERFNWISVATSMFLHGGWMHLLGNMLFLWVFGDNIEDILGSGKFLLFYLLCGVGAAVGQYLINPDSRVPMVGASGAIAGVMGAYMIKFPHARITMVGWFIFIFSFDLPAWVVLMYWFALQFFSGFGAISDVSAQRGGTAFFAHIGGFIAGMALIHLFKTRDRYRLRRDLLW
ncbi:MAG: rhomboid family intramembrane serine protease [Candidatus Solibacter usitatus]|nr:rhomboid family intramembrane serine protease [Candidatus Solibacter usitatus]